MVKEGKVTTVQGNDLSIQADTVCIHGDGEHALEFAESIRAGLKKASIDVVKITDVLRVNSGEASTNAK
jgi:UPF0271 protein